MTATLGMSARVVQISGADGTQTDVATLPSINLGTEAEGGSRLAQLRGITAERVITDLLTRVAVPGGRTA